MSLIRAFIAIPLSAALKQQIAKQTESLRTRIDAHNVRWVAPRNIHLTLKFLGNINEMQQKKLEENLAKEMVKFSPFQLSIGDLGVFPHKGRPNVIWLGVENSKNLLTLQECVRTVASQIGSVPEKSRFSPHLTLGRVSRRGRHKKIGLQIQNAIEQSPPIAFAPIRVNAVHLFQSELTPQGAKYRSLFDTKLGEFFE
jgi:2'-5' RNA ligase